ncbi:hypothetical protein PR048_018976 [Dryococelus australis]|uniref:Uncharacterized protein n=1 Tax=Dryococelus australis TaxID=614101 RepID=A0ABQ9H270_9NEOP|nr:hypothetical protein PR048_018976 [Dryococelus australis]
MEQPRNERPGETGDPRENPLTNGIVRHDSNMRKNLDRGCRVVLVSGSRDSSFTRPEGITEEPSTRMLGGENYDNIHPAFRGNGVCCCYGRLSQDQQLHLYVVRKLPRRTRTLPPDAFPIYVSRPTRYSDVESFLAEARSSKGRDARAALVTLSAVSKTSCGASILLLPKTEDRMILGRPICCQSVSVVAQLKTGPEHHATTTDAGEGRGGVVVRMLTSHLCEPGPFPGGVASGFSRAGIVPDDAAGRRVFSGISRFPRPYIPALLHTHLYFPIIGSQESHSTLFTHSLTHSSTLYNWVCLIQSGAEIQQPLMLLTPPNRKRAYRRRTQRFERQKEVDTEDEAGVYRSGSDEPMSVIEVSMEQHRNERTEETGGFRENPPTNDIVRHVSHMRNKTGLVFRRGLDKRGFRRILLRTQSPRLAITCQIVRQADVLLRVVEGLDVGVESTRGVGRMGISRRTGPFDNRYL